MQPLQQLSVDSAEGSLEEEVPFGLPSYARPFVNEPEAKRQKTGLEMKEEQATQAPEFVSQNRIENSARRRRIIRQIKHYAKQNPKIDIFAISDIDRQLVHMDDEELRSVLDNIKDISGGVNVYAAPCSLVKIISPQIERALNRPGMSRLMNNDMDLISALDDLIPSRISDFGAPLQILASFAMAYANAQPENHTSDGGSNTSESSAGDRSIADGEDDLRGPIDSRALRQSGG
jgi:hypothetical protein